MPSAPLHHHHHHHYSSSLLLRCCYCCLSFTITLLTLPIAAATAADLNSDRQALLDFAAAVPHPLSRKLNWNTDSFLCTSWAGVSCSTRPTRVVALHLPAAGFYGAIPPNTLGRLDALASLSLRSNRLYGPLPPDILSLPSLRFLYFQHNNFSGGIPSSLSSHLYSLDLSFNSFTGNIPAALNNLTRLVALNLQNNSLTGPIPDLSALLGLQQLNLSNNQLNGSIPHSLQRFPASSFHGNPLLCGTPLNQCPSVASPSPSPSPSPAPAPLSYSPSPSSFDNSPYSPATLPSSPTAAPFHKKRIVKAKLSTGSTVAIAVASSAVLFLLILLSRLLCCTKKKEENQVGKGMDINGGGGGGRIEKSGWNNGAPLEDENSKLVFLLPGLGVSTTTTTRSTLDNNFDLDDLLRASAEVLGKGTYGTTYKATLEEGTTVAVKRLKQVVVGKREFEQHMQNVGRLNRHANVVPLRAYYYSKDEKLLIYDYAPFGNLYTLLHAVAGNREESGRTILDWESRLKICVGAARGIAHIHSVDSGRLVHGNIKSSNVLLLTRDLSGCISDVGITPLVGLYATPSRKTGYQAPEVSEFRKYTQKSDVYSFGVVLLEMLTGKVPVRSPPGLGGMEEEEAVDLPRWVQSVVREEWTAEVFDIELIKYQNIEEEMMQLLQVALACVARLPETRPKMDQVVKMIEEIQQPDVENRPSSSEN